MQLANIWGGHTVLVATPVHQGAPTRLLSDLASRRLARHCSRSSGNACNAIWSTPQGWSKEWSSVCKSPPIETRANTPPYHGRLLTKTPSSISKKLIIKLPEFLATFFESIKKPKRVALVGCVYISDRAQLPWRYGAWPGCCVLYRAPCRL